MLAEMDLEVGWNVSQRFLKLWMTIPINNFIVILKIGICPEVCFEGLHQAMPYHALLISSNLPECVAGRQQMKLYKPTHGHTNFPNSPIVCLEGNIMI